jgi:hypothetical protein
MYLSCFVLWIACVESRPENQLLIFVYFLSTTRKITEYQLNTCHDSFCPHDFQITNNPNIRYYIIYLDEKVSINKLRLSAGWRLVCTLHRTCKSVNLYSSKDKDSLACSSLNNSLFYISNNKVHEVNTNRADQYSLMLNHSEGWLIIMHNQYSNPRTKRLWHRTKFNGLCGCFIYSTISQHELGVPLVRLSLKHNDDRLLKGNQLMDICDRVHREVCCFKQMIEEFRSSGMLPRVDW